MAVSPNDKLIATGSQDKTAKVRIRVIFGTIEIIIIIILAFYSEHKLVVIRGRQLAWRRSIVQSLNSIYQLPPNTKLLYEHNISHSANSSLTLICCMIALDETHLYIFFISSDMASF